VKPGAVSPPPAWPGAFTATTSKKNFPPAAARSRREAEPEQKSLPPGLADLFKKPED
jgi:hypothetical protein